MEIISLSVAVTAAAAASAALVLCVRCNAGKLGAEAEHRRLRRRLEDSLAAVNGYRGAGESK